jgi:tetratricopeptide (TPR) repeat protein
MMSYQGQLGLDYSASNEESIIQFDDFIDKYLASHKDAMPCLDKLIESDGEVPMAFCFRGYILKMAGDPKFSAPIRSSLKSLGQLNGSMNTREKMHQSALESWVGNQYTEAADTLEQLLKQYPRDILALRLVHYLHFYAGDAIEMRDSVLRSAKIWAETDPHYGYLLGMESFGFEECGDYEEAEAAGKQAVEINNKDIWAAHAVAHVYQMQGRTDEGIPWVGGLLGNWDESNNFVYHLHWHKALFHIGAGELDEALGIYDSNLTDCLADDFYLDVCNAAALLWRLEMHGLNVGDRWQALREFSTRRIQDDELVFSTLHYLMTPAVLKDEKLTNEAIDHFQAWSQEQTTQGAVCRKVGLPLAQTIVELGQGKFKEATTRLSSIKDDIYLIGGSHAQRHLFDDLLTHYKAMA